MISGRPSPQTSPLPPPPTLHCPLLSLPIPSPPVLIPLIHLYSQYSFRLFILTIKYSSHLSILTLQYSTHLSILPLHYSSHLSIYLSIYTIQYSSTYLSKPSSTHPLYLSIYTIPSGAHPVYLSIYQSIPSSLSI